MTNHPHQEHVDTLNEMKRNVQSLQTEWLETLDAIATNKAEIKENDFFDMIDYLTFCDELCMTLHIELRALDADLQSVKKIKEEFTADPKALNFIDSLMHDIQGMKKNKYEKLQQNMDEEYTSLAEDVLRQAEDVVFAFSEEILQEKSPSLQAQITQNLDKELFLQELRDSLESYREAREEFLTEVEMNTLQTLPDNQIPEDFGEERPEMDSILSQLDTLITSCDTALLHKEIGD